MNVVKEDRALTDFFGEAGDVAVERQPPGRVAIAKDNARLFVGNVINQYSKPPNKEAFSIDVASVNDSLIVNPRVLTLKVLRAVTKVTDRLRTCQRQAARVKIADLAIASLHTECSSIRLRLNQIKALVNQEDEESLEDRFEGYLLEEYEDVLQACCLPFSILNRHLENLELDNLTMVNRDDLKSKLQELWAYERMEMICHNIRGLARAVDILCSAFHSSTSIKASDIIKEPGAKKLLANISNDAVSLHESFESATGSRERSIRDSIVGDEVFEFDNVLTNTTLYKKAYLRRVVLSQNFDHEKGQDTFDIPSSADELAEWNGDTKQYDKDIDLVSQLQPSSIASVTARESNVRPESTRHIGITTAPSQMNEVATESGLLNQQKYRSLEGSILDDSSNTTRHELGIDAASDMEHNYVSNIALIADLGESNETHADSLTSELGSADQDSDTVAETASSTTNLDELISTKLSIDKISGLEYSADRATDKGKNLPTLADVLRRRTTKPYGLFEFYVYMRDIQRAVDYLDFWIDVNQLISLDRHYHRSLIQHSSRKTDETVAWSDVQATAEKIIYTFILPGSDRQIALPEPITEAMIKKVEVDRIFSTSIFETANDYVFEAMDRDAFPGFLQTGKPLYRAARKAFGPLANVLIRPGPRR